MYGEDIPIVLEEEDSFIVKVKSSLYYLTDKGNLYGCGWNKYGQQGDGTTTMF